MVTNIDPEEVRKLAGWGLTQDNRASFAVWSQSASSRFFVERMVGPVGHV